MRALAAVALLAFAACTGSGAGADVASPRVVRFEPPHAARDVAVGSAFTVEFSEPLSVQSALSPTGAVLVRGIPSGALLSDISNPPITRSEVVPCDRSLAGANRLRLRPQVPLRPLVTYSLVATKTLRDRAGNRLAGAPKVASFVTAPSRVRLVVPEGIAPVNLLAVVLAYPHPIEVAPAPGEVRVLSDEGTEVPILAGAPFPDRRLQAFELLVPPRPATGYVVITRYRDVEEALPFAVGEARDARPPRLDFVEGRPGPSGMLLEIRLDEPGWLQIETSRSSVSAEGTVFSPFLREHTVLVGDAPLGAEIFYRIVATDAAGLVLTDPPRSLPPRSLLSRPWLRVEIDEVITDAQHDWSDQLCECGANAGSCGEPFDAWPGCDESVGARDEWVELVNRSERIIDLLEGPRHWRVRTVDTTPESTPLAEETPRYFSAGGSLQSWRPDERLVVKTAGNSNNDTRFELVDPWGAVIDKVELGRGGVPSGRASGAWDEAVHRAPNGEGWCKGPATPGLPSQACALDDYPGR